MKEVKNYNNLGRYIALFTALITVITFAIAVFTPPVSGPFCKGLCVDYPYTNIIIRFPRDYIWLYPAIFMNLSFVVLIGCIHLNTTEDKKIFSQTGLSFSIISATILIVDYYIQISVIQPSIERGEFDGISILTQYNPHGIFISLEEIGYFIMALTFICMVPVFSNKDKLERAIRWLFILCFILTIFSFIIISVQYGIHREYYFEIAVITINWMVLIVAGILLSILFKQASKSQLTTNDAIKTENDERT
jgi:hypothetical protein